VKHCLTQFRSTRRPAPASSPWGKHPPLQVLTIAELLAGKKIDMPPAQGVKVTFKPAPKAKKGPAEKQLRLEGDGKDVGEGTSRRAGLGESCGRVRVKGEPAPATCRPDYWVEGVYDDGR